MVHISTFDSKILGRKRKVRVFLPDQYKAGGDGPFPGRFAQDGQLLFSDRDEELPFGSWQVDLRINELAGAGVIRPAVVIGIDNSPHRLQEYFPLTPEFERYERFLEEEVTPSAQ